MSDNSPPNLDLAKNRLEEAVNRLEAALSKVGPGPAAQGQAMSAEFAALKADHERLGKALATAETDYASLREITAEVAGRLDTTIEGLKDLLDD